MIRWIETYLDPFSSDRLDQPPQKLAAFFRHYLVQAWGMFALTLFTAALVAVLGAALYAYVGVLIDRIEQAPDASSFFADNLGLLIGVTILVTVLTPGVDAIHIMVMNQGIVPSFTNLVRWQTHRYVLRQSMGFFQDDFAGRIANKVLQTSLGLRRAVAEFINAVWYVSVFVVSALAILADNDWRLALPLLVWVALYAAALRRWVPEIKQRSTVSSEAYSRLTGRVVDSYTNILTVKLFSHANREDDYARAGIAEQNARTADLLRSLTAINIVVGALHSFLIVSVGGTALWLWSVQELSVGAVAASIGLAMRISMMSHWIMNVATGIAENVGVVQEGIGTISRPHAVVDRPDAVALRVERGEVRYEHIGFRYGQAAAVIEDLSLTVAPGEKVGLVGRSGAGKSTLVQLLLRFHDLDGGRILIDGQDVRDVSQESLRHAIGMVTQDTSLLHRSVADNIRYGHPEATMEQVIEAARQAHAHDFILGLEDRNGRRGYDAQVGERGVKLSGGQRQRVAIARVLLKNAPILILDEATSALDSEVEAAIQEQLFNLMAGKTVIAIAHRLSTIAAMDRLVIMDRGRIVEQGSHNELLRRGGLYADMWSRQAGGFLAEDTVAAE